MTFAEVVAATQARLGQRVRVSTEERGRIRHNAEGVLKPEVPGTTEAIPDEHGRVGFKIVEPGPHALGFILDPRSFAAAQEQPDGRLLRVETRGGMAVVIESVEAPYSGPQSR